MGSVMKKYQQLAQQIAVQSALDVWKTGEKLPSLREQVRHSGMSLMTVSHTYQRLESCWLLVRSPAIMLPTE